MAKKGENADIYGFKVTDNTVVFHGYIHSVSEIFFTSNAAIIKVYTIFYSSVLQ